MKKKKIYNFKPITFPQAKKIKNSVKTTNYEHVIFFLLIYLNNLKYEKAFVIPCPTIPKSFSFKIKPGLHRAHTLSEQ